MTTRTLKWLTIIGTALLAVPTASLAQTAQATTPLPDVRDGTSSVAAEYVLGPEDVVEIEVVGSADRTRARVYTDGSIQVNLIGNMPVAGKTPKQLGQDVAKALKVGGYYSEPVVNVEIVGYASRYVTVLGAVGSPGLIPINRSYRLSEILARVGGVRETAADYVIVRGETGGEKRYDVDKIASGASEDPIVLPGDKIFSPQAEIFYISGQVNSPGSYALKSGMTIAQAIAKGGGLSESGTDKKVKVRRAGKIVKLSGDAPVQPGDVLTVGERLF
jgi:polysaccharide export outer membrane protein